MLLFTSYLTYTKCIGTDLLLKKILVGKKEGEGEGVGRGMGRGFLMSDL